MCVRVFVNVRFCVHACMCVYAKHACKTLCVCVCGCVRVWVCGRGVGGGMHKKMELRLVYRACQSIRICIITGGCVCACVCSCFVA